MHTHTHTHIHTRARMQTHLHTNALRIPRCGHEHTRAHIIKMPSMLQVGHMAEGEWVFVLRVQAEHAAFWPRALFQRMSRRRRKGTQPDQAYLSRQGI